MQHVKKFLEPLEKNHISKMHKNRPRSLLADPLALRGNAHPHIAIMGGKCYFMRLTVQTLVHHNTILFPKLKEPMRGRRFFFSGRASYRYDGTRVIPHMNVSQGSSTFSVRGPIYIYQIILRAAVTADYKIIMDIST